MSRLESPHYEAVFCVTLVFLLSVRATSVVVRHDVPDERYHAEIARFPELALLPGEGHGVLISSRWVVTAAHAAVWRPIHDVVLNGTPRRVSKVVIHPGYRAIPRELESGNAAALMEVMASRDDIALIELALPANDVKPAAIYRGSDELAKIAEIVGRGATGNGLVGQFPHSPHAGELRRAYSRIISADERWLGMRFEAPPGALPLEGMPADGDSGAPIFIQTEHGRELAGLVSRKFATGNLAEFRCCHYGQITFQVRLSRYAAWIDSTIRTMGIPS